MKPKDLVPTPWMVAMALQADGWYLRKDIIWAKPNPMPESVTDRPTKAHEYIFLLAKSERYHYDADAIREAVSPWNTGKVSVAPHGAHVMDTGHRQQELRTYDVIKGANRRSVWSIATRPYPGAHFATFPEALVEPCVLAGTSQAGCCATCGAPWERLVERGELVGKDRGGNYEGRVIDRLVKRNPGTPGMSYENITTGWQRTCAHDGDPVPCVVLDPFAGTGTVGVVAQRLSRRAVLIDLNPDYLVQCLERNQQTPLGLAG